MPLCEVSVFPPLKYYDLECVRRNMHSFMEVETVAMHMNELHSKTEWKENLQIICNMF